MQNSSEGDFIFLAPWKSKGFVVLSLTNIWDMCVVDDISR